MYYCKVSCIVCFFSTKIDQKWGCLLYIWYKNLIIFFSECASEYRNSIPVDIVCYASTFNLFCQKCLILNSMSMYWNIYSLFLASNKFLPVYLPYHN